MPAVILTVAAIVLAIVAVATMRGGGRLYAREGLVSYAGIPVVLAGICIACAASIAALGATIHVFGAIGI